MGWAEVSDVGSIGGKPMTPTLGMDRGVLLTAYSAVRYIHTDQNPAKKLRSQW
jgi:hypothetical protein